MKKSFEAQLPEQTGTKHEIADLVLDDGGVSNTVEVLDDNKRKEDLLNQQLESIRLTSKSE